MGWFERDFHKEIPFWMTKPALNGGHWYVIIVLLNRISCASFCDMVFGCLLCDVRLSPAWSPRVVTLTYHLFLLLLCRNALALFCIALYILETKCSESTCKVMHSISFLHGGGIILLINFYIRSIKFMFQNY